jgi:thiol-disulfide isomerase/thioredoxin
MSTDPDRSSNLVRQAVHPVSPPPSSSSTKALVGILLAGMVGMGIFLFVLVSRDDRPSVRVSINSYNNYSATGGSRPGPAPAHAECAKGQRDCLPDVSYVDTTGVAYPHDSLAGKVVVVNFWATWCHPCRNEIPDLSRAYDKYKSQGVVFFGVMTDNPDSQQLLNFQSDYEMTYPIVRANSDLLVSYNYPEAVPTTFVFDRRGKQVLSHVGALRERDLDSLLGQLVAQN